MVNILSYYIRLNDAFPVKKEWMVDCFFPSMQCLHFQNIKNIKVQLKRSNSSRGPQKLVKFSESTSYPSRTYPEQKVGLLVGFWRDRRNVSHLAGVKLIQGKNYPESTVVSNKNVLIFSTGSTFIWKLVVLYILH